MYQCSYVYDQNLTMLSLSLLISINIDCIYRQYQCSEGGCRSAQVSESKVVFTK